MGFSKDSTIGEPFGADYKKLVFPQTVSNEELDADYRISDFPEAIKNIAVEITEILGLYENSLRGM